MEIVYFFPQLAIEKGRRLKTLGGTDIIGVPCHTRAYMRFTSVWVTLI